MLAGSNCALWFRIMRNRIGQFIVISIFISYVEIHSNREISFCAEVYSLRKFVDIGLTGSYGCSIWNTFFYLCLIIELKTQKNIFGKTGSRIFNTNCYKFSIGEVAIILRIYNSLHCKVKSTKCNIFHGTNTYRYGTQIAINIISHNRC